MATLARSPIKVLMFAGLFFLSIRYVYAPLLFFPPWNQHYSFAISVFFGFHDIELFDAIFGLIVSLAMAIIEYASITRLWAYICAKRKDAAAR
ncbi:hypothetical protein [Burkholderia guangdongensis]|uniref:hypothetical protein n=1 Tax=Burkholderia guangdongensis TaxID=1792500 RepID=UPI0015C9D68E|nr:hypothetical protein [Burkholderia guangdongensis]